MGSITAVSPIKRAGAIDEGHAAITTMRGDGGGQVARCMIRQCEARRRVPTVAADKHDRVIAAAGPTGRLLGEGKRARGGTADRIGQADAAAVSAVGP